MWASEDRGPQRMEMLQLTKNKNSEPVIICHLSPLRTSHSIRMLKSPRSQQTQHLYFLILTDADDINVMRVVKTCVLSKDQSSAAIQCINVSLGQKDQNWTSKLSTIKVLVKIVQNTFAFPHLFRGRVSDTCSKTLQISGMATDNFLVVITVCGDELGKSQVLQLEIHESLIVCLSLRLIFRVPPRGI